MNAHPTIRQADKSDIPILVGILRNSFADVAERFGLTPENCPKNLAFCNEQRVEEDFARNLQYCILEQDGQPHGCVAMEVAGPDFCYLQRLAVLPEHRRKGLGAALVKHILDEASKLRMQRVEIGIISEDARLKNWYRKFGFVEKNTKKFDHLPFIVSFLYAQLPEAEQ
ncbi:MAG: GNAT family N-acetyltransferase [Planctomycetota bacterium]|jgi:N-acetylglutamate synthase-like GNAT family acetyltransferase